MGKHVATPFSVSPAAGRWRIRSRRRPHGRIWEAYDPDPAWPYRYGHDTFVQALAFVAAEQHRRGSVTRLTLVTWVKRPILAVTGQLQKAA